MIFLDSNALIAFLRGDLSIERFFKKHKNSIFAIPVLILYEIYYGFYYPLSPKGFKVIQIFFKN
ncbi:MAG: Ribonuclease VapC [Promethearchaeota archaeon]|nr:MAG: Ribonuclease VapC [Candidatus Lokiarchaeota archaeon]